MRLRCRSNIGAKQIAREFAKQAKDPLLQDFISGTGARLGCASGGSRAGDEITPRKERSVRLMFTLKAFVALVVTWCLLALAAILAASTKRFERWYLYLVAAVVLVGARHNRGDSARAVVARQAKLMLSII
jgi:hypothetical protein